MDIAASWHHGVISQLAILQIEVSETTAGKFRLLTFQNKALVINLVSIDNPFDAEELIFLQTQYLETGGNLIHLWEDVWKSREQQVLSRIQSLLGCNKRIHARKTKVVTVTKPIADAFLEANHIQSTASSRYRLGLTLDDELVALACFSNLRIMKGKEGGTYRSAEVIRFASLSGYTVTGGFTKLLKHFIAKFAPDDIMSYADRDWSTGKVYEQAGFQLVDITLPSIIYLDRNTMARYFPHRLPLSNASCANEPGNETSFVKIFNTGNLKYIYTV